MDSLPFSSKTSSALDPLAPLIDLEPTIGSFFLGAIACVGLTGVTTLQAWLYFHKYPQDTIYLKILVAFVWTLEILRSAISVHAGYYYSVKHWGNFSALLHPVWSMKLMIMLTNTVELAVHGFFITKVWRATYGQAKILCILITLFALGDFGMGTVAYVLSVLSSSYTDILHGLPSHYATAALVCAIGADWLITGALVKFFRINKSQFPRTSHLIKKLIFYAVNLGLLTSFADVVVLILANYRGWKTLNFYQLTVFEIVGNLYANTFLACLNARNMVSEELSSTRTYPRSFTVSFPTGPGGGTGHSNNTNENSRSGATTSNDTSNIQLSSTNWTSTTASSSSSAFESHTQLPNESTQSGLLKSHTQLPNESTQSGLLKSQNSNSDIKLPTTQ